MQDQQIIVDVSQKIDRQFIKDYENFLFELDYDQFKDDCFKKEMKLMMKNTFRNIDLNLRQAILFEKSAKTSKHFEKLNQHIEKKQLQHKNEYDNLTNLIQTKIDPLLQKIALNQSQLIQQQSDKYQKEYFQRCQISINNNSLNLNSEQRPSINIKQKSNKEKYECNGQNIETQNAKLLLKQRSLQNKLKVLRFLNNKNES